ncbi:MAG: histidine phosphatase family protein [Caldilineaceae bacterium]
MPFNLLIIRHAESTNNTLAESKDYQTFVATRTHDPAITERGVAQAQQLAQHLASSSQREFSRSEPVYPQGYGITRLVASPMLRTLQTAAPVAAALDMPIEIWTDIFEQGGLFDGNPEDGTLRSFPGLTRNELSARYPGILLPADVTDRGWWRGGYEEMDACSARAKIVAARVQHLAEQHQSKEAGGLTTLAMVSHGTFINQFLRHLFGLAEEATSYFFHANTGITRVEFAHDGFRVVRYINRTQHLPSDLISR